MGRLVRARILCGNWKKNSLDLPRYNTTSRRVWMLKLKDDGVQSSGPNETRRISTVRTAYLDNLRTSGRPSESSKVLLA
jgi:hypothetical protein